jgi:hypothetical protein
MRASLEESLSRSKPFFDIESKIKTVLKQHIGSDYTEAFSKCLKDCKSKRDYTLTSKFYSNVKEKEKKQIGQLAFAVARLNYNKLSGSEDAGRNRDLKAKIREISCSNNPLVSSAFSSLSSLLPSS